VHRLILIRTPGDRRQLSDSPTLPPLSAETLQRHAPDAHWVAVEDARITGRLSLWWRNTPAHGTESLGYIGHFAVEDAATAHALLTRACAELRANGCSRAVGPIDGNTWRNYRFVTESDGSPPFFLEPANPAEWPRQFLDHGFTELANYESTVDEHLDVDDEQSYRAAERMEQGGITLRPINLDRFADELRVIYRITMASFRTAYLFQPMDEAEYLAQYAALRPFVQPELVLIACHQDRPIGFIFAVRDLCQERAERPVDTAILKSLAVLPGRQSAGLGIHLTAACRRGALALGCHRLVHALMRSSNSSRLIRPEFTRLVRRYTLFAKPL
jgi:GNAT superfamily N-acetyltransferase